MLSLAPENAPYELQRHRVNPRDDPMNVEEIRMDRVHAVSVVDAAWGRATTYTIKSINELITEELEITKATNSSTALDDVVPETVINTSFVEDETTKSDPELDKEDADNVLSYMLASIFATILEEALTELRILVECNSELRIIKTISDMGLLLALKYGVVQPKVVDELEGIDPKNLGSNENKIYKLDSDRNSIINVITDTYIYLSINRSFKPLNKYIKDILDRDIYRINLAEEEVSNKASQRDLNRQLRQQRNHIKLVLYDTDVTIDDLKTQVEDSVLMSECSGRYVDGWQWARTEQHLETFTNQENGTNEQIEYYKRRSDHEQRVHSEVELLVNISINETLEKIETWMNKYDKDMEKIDLTIQIKKNDYHDMMDKRINLEETIEKHDNLMKEWNNFKEEREKARLYREKMNKSAIIVQAWWRGLLVRRQLGPYRVAKKKGGIKKK